MIQKNIVNDVMDEVELEDAKLRYIESIQFSAKLQIYYGYLRFLWAPESP